MIFFGVVLGLGILSATVFMALDKKSNLPVRIASLAAIAIMLLTIIICLIIGFTDNRVPVDESVLIVGAPAEVKKEGSGNNMILALLIIFMVVFFLVIALLSIHENSKQKKKNSDDGKKGLIL
jgi:ABC-type Fe3+ transport system permease subunit